MNACKSGEEVLRWTLLFGRRRSLWKHCGSLLQRKSALLNKRSDSALSSLWSGRQLKGHALKGATARYYSQGGTQGQALDGPGGQPSSALGARSPSVPTILVKREGRALFYDQLRECASPTDVLDLAGRYTATHWQVSNSLTRLWETTKKLSEEQRRSELQRVFEHPGFEELCQRAVADAARMRSEDLAYSLLATVKLGVSSRSRVVQTLLRVTQERLNEFDEKSLSVLSFCLEDLESSQNMEALKEGLRLVLEDRIPKTQNVVFLQTVMRLVGKDAPIEVKKKLEQKALSMSKAFTLPNAQYMMATLATMGFRSKPLLDVCSKKIAENVHGVPFSRLVVVLKSCKELQYRSPTLLSTISQYVATTCDMWSNKQVILFLVGFEDLGFRPASLMDAFSERVIRNSDALTLKDTLRVLKTYALLNHDLRSRRQEFLDSVTRMLESYLPKLPAKELLNAVFCLSILGHFPLAPLEKLLHKETLEELLTKGGQSQRGIERKLHTVELCLRLDNPPLPRPLIPPQDSLFSLAVAPHDLPVNPGLVETLKCIVGADAVQEGVVTENVYFIDCLVTLPLQTTEGQALLEGKAHPPERTRRIAVLCAPPSSFCFGTSHPRGNLAVKLRHLKLLGYNPVLVPVHKLNSQSDEERAQALRRLIFPEKEHSGMENSQCDSPGGE